MSYINVSFRLLQFYIKKARPSRRSFAFFTLECTNADGLPMCSLSDFDLKSLLMIQFAATYLSSDSWASNSSSQIATSSQRSVLVSSSYHISMVWLGTRSVTQRRSGTTDNMRSGQDTHVQKCQHGRQMMLRCARSKRLWLKALLAQFEAKMVTDCRRTGIQ